MDGLIRIGSEYDHQTMLQLRERLGGQALSEVVLRMDVHGWPYTSEIYHTLGLTPLPHKCATSCVRLLSRAVGEAYLATIRGILDGGHATV